MYFTNLLKKTHISFSVRYPSFFYKQLPGFECNLALGTKLTHDCCRKRLVGIVSVNLLHVTLSQYVSKKVSQSYPLKLKREAVAGIYRVGGCTVRLMGCKHVPHPGLHSRGGSQA